MLDLWKFSHLDTRFYRHVGQFSAWRITFYILGFYLLLSLALTTLFSFRTWPEWKTNSELIWSSIEQQWPDGVTAQLENGELNLVGEIENNEETSQLATPSAITQKIEIDWPTDLSRNSNLPQSMVVISPDDGADQIEQYPSWLVATRHDLWVKGASSGKFESFSWNELTPDENLSISKQTFSQQQSKWQAFLNYGLFSLLPLVFLWFFVIRLITRALNLLFMSWLSQPVLGMFGWQINYKKTYRVGLFLLVIAEEISFILKLLYPQNPVFSFWLIWMMALLIVGWTNRRLMIMAKK